MIKVTLNRDEQGTPIKAVVEEGQKKVTATFDKYNLLIEGSRRSLSTELLNILKLIYPYSEPPVFSIPQPLQTVDLEGGQVMLYDDFEELLKWSGTATPSLDNTKCYGGSKSLKITVGAGADEYADRFYALSNVTGKYRIEWLFAVEDWTEITRMKLQWRRHPKPNGYTEAQLSVYQDKIEIETPDGTVELPSVTENFPNNGAVNAAWDRLSLSVDYSKKLYDTLKIGGQIIDLSNYGLVVDTATVGPRMGWVRIWGNNAAAGDAVFWIDDFRILEKV